MCIKNSVSINLPSTLVHLYSFTFVEIKQKPVSSVHLEKEWSNHKDAKINTRPYNVYFMLQNITKADSSTIINK